VIAEPWEMKVCKFAERKHRAQKDDEGKRYYLHVWQVAQTVRMVTDDIDIITAAYLHDTIEDTDTTYREIFDNFGQVVADLVMEVTHEGKKDSYGYYFPRLKSRDAILIKLADRMSNISRMDAWDIARKEHYLRKTKFWKDGSDR